MDNNRFIVVNKDIPVVKPINPKVSLAERGCKTPNFNGSNAKLAELKPKTLYEVMRNCAAGSYANLPKGTISMHSYVSNLKGVKPYVFDGVIFIDLDKFNVFPELNGVQHQIFDRFEELCKVMHNLLCIKYSPSGNLHFCVYHDNIKDSNDFAKHARIYLCCLCQAVRKVIGVDLREFTGAIDPHLCIPEQQLNINDSPVKWNFACVSVKLDKKILGLLNAEYGEYLKYTYKHVDVAPTEIKGDGTTVVDNNFYITGKCGYDARTAIAATAYFHFKKDYTLTEEWLANTFNYTKEWQGQLKSLVTRNTIAHYYNRTIELLLFDYTNDNYIIIPEGQYMSDMIDFNNLTSKFNYLNAGTGAGKTEVIKKLLKKNDSKVILLQMNKALRDGKQQSIEDITRSNTKWDDALPKDKIHTTMEGFNRNCSNLDLSEYIVVIDEAHLLQDYCMIDGKYYNIIIMLSLIKNAKQIIFMSATPKWEQKLFDFDMKRFLRFKEQTLLVNMHPLKYVGKGSKEATRYTEMLNTITSIEGKHIIFSNKNQKRWKDYGLDKIDYTWFHAKNIEDPKMQSILKNNKLMTDITLATLYLGVGVEIKHETDIHIWFDLNEGWDKSFIEQSIGRPRDAERIHLHFFYTYDSEIKAGILSEEEITAVKNAFDNLVIDIDGTPTVNLIAAKIIGIYDANFDTYEDVDKKRIEILKIGQIISNKDYFTVYDTDLLRRLPYKEFKIITHDKIILNTDGKERIDRNEDQLKLHLCSRTDTWWNNWTKNHTTYEDILKELDVYWNDKYNANKMLDDCKKVWNGALDLSLADEYFGSMHLARTVLKDVDNYCNVKVGKNVLSDFVGGETTKEEIEKSFKRVETAFSKDWLKYRIGRKELGRKPRPEIIEVYDDIYGEILGIENIVIGGEDVEIPYPFRNNNWKETLKELKPEANKDNGKKGGAKKQGIILINKVTKERVEFESKSECRKFLKTGSKQFSKWIKGEPVKKLTDWNIINLA